MLAVAEEPSLGEIYLNGDHLESGRHDPVLKRRLGYLPEAA